METDFGPFRGRKQGFKMICFPLFGRLKAEGNRFWWLAGAAACENVPNDLGDEERFCQPRCGRPDLIRCCGECTVDLGEVDRWLDSGPRQRLYDVQAVAHRVLRSNHHMRLGSGILEIHGHGLPKFEKCLFSGVGMEN
jgi:hypothetical protein